MTHYIAFQHNYKALEIGLFKDETLIAVEKEEKNRASKYIITLVDSILKKNSLSPSSLSFIATNQGPGPFATLRVIISTMNGISFASKIPLIGVDGIKSLINEHAHQSIITIALLNAYGKDVYYAISYPGNNKVETGWDNINLFLEKIEKDFPEKNIHFIGNGVELFKETIEQRFKNLALIPQDLPLTCSISQVGKEAFKTWNSPSYKKEYNLYPLYLKSGMYKPSIIQDSSD